MALTSSGKDYIAENFGIGNCFVDSGVSWTSVDVNGTRLSESGGTKNVVARLINDMVYARIEMSNPSTGTFTKTQLIAANGGQSITLADADAIGNEDSGAAQYCTGAPPTGCTVGTRRCEPGTTDTCQECVRGTPNYWRNIEICPSGQHCSGGYCVVDSARPETGPLEVYVGGGSDCAAGAPNVTLDTSGAFAFFKSESYDYIGVGGIDVHNLDTNCRAHFAWEARVWDTPGYGYTTCPTSNPEMQEINRFLVNIGSRPLSTTMLHAGETDVVWGSFEITPGMEGEKTLCLSLWGNFSKQALIDELNATGYYDK